MLQKMNLTAVTDANEVMKRHVEDSLALLRPIRDSYVSHCNSSVDNLKLVDVGTGPGLPGLVLAIACPGEFSILFLYPFYVLFFSLMFYVMVFYFLMKRRLENNPFGVHEQALRFPGACS